MSDPFFKVILDKKLRVREANLMQSRVFEGPGTSAPEGLGYDFDSGTAPFPALPSGPKLVLPVLPNEYGSGGVAGGGKGSEADALDNPDLEFDMEEYFSQIVLMKEEAVSNERARGRMWEEAECARREARSVLEKARELKDAVERERLEAGRVLEEAREQSAGILEQARRQAEEVEAKAYQAGFVQGEEGGKALGEQKMNALVKNLSALLSNAALERDAMLRDSEADVAKAALALTLQLLHREIQQDPSVVLDMARAALSRVRSSTRLVFQVSTGDYPFVEGHLDELSALAGPGTRVEAEASPDISRGGCRLVCDTGMVDATIESLVQNLLGQVLEEDEKG